MNRLSPLLRRLCALGLLAGLTGALWAFVALPIMDRTEDLDQAIARTGELLARSQRTAAEQPRLRAERDRLESNLTADAGFLEGDSFELIAAALQDQIKRTVGRHKGNLDSLQTLPSQTQEGFRRVTVRVTLSADTLSLQRILHGIESAQPVLLVDNLEVSVSALRASRKASEVEALIVRLDVFGFVRGELS